MILNKEIEALLHLIDDPDQFVYETVSERLLSFGRPIIPELEQLWQNSDDLQAQERIESLIHRLHYRDLYTEFRNWAQNSDDLTQGALLVSKYNYPDLEITPILQQIEKIRRNVWLELNSFLTPMEQVNVINSIIFNYYKHAGAELDYENPDLFLLHKTLESKKGNAICNGILYLILCQKLDIPVYALNIPLQFIMGYSDEEGEGLRSHGHGSEKIKFYIDGLSGQMYSQRDMENYFKRMNVPPVNAYFKPMDNKDIIKFLLTEYQKCFESITLDYKKEEIQNIINLL